ncbi:hypothetical protein [Nocardia asiatica]
MTSTSRNLNRPVHPVRSRRTQVVSECRSTVPKLGINRAAKIRRSRAAKGIPSMVPAQPIQQHVQRLMAMGFTCYSIAAAAGVGWRTVMSIADGVYAETKIIHASRIMAVTHHPVPAQSGMRVPSVGTHRRLHALRAIGWPYHEIAARLDVTRQSVTSYMLSDSVTYETWQAIAEIYDELSGTPGPSKRTINAARKEGLAPPLAWEGKDIDHPDSAPDLGTDTDTAEIDSVLLARILRGEHRGNIPKAERAAALDHAIANGWNRTQVANMLNLSLDAADQALVRRRRKLRKEAA